MKKVSRKLLRLKADNFEITRTNYSDSEFLKQNDFLTMIIQIEKKIFGNYKSTGKVRKKFCFKNRSHLSLLEQILLPKAVTK